MAPSTFAARHRSVLEVSRGGGPGGIDVPVYVIAPGVNATAFSRGGDSEGSRLAPACPSHSADLSSSGSPFAPCPSLRARSPSSPLSARGFRCGGPCPLVGFMGRLAPEKSVGLFLAAARTIATSWPSARFIVIGDGMLLKAKLLLFASIQFLALISTNYKHSSASLAHKGPMRDPLEDLARRLGVRMHFTGGVYGHAALSSQLSALDVLVSYYHEAIVSDELSPKTPPPREPNLNKYVFMGFNFLLANGR